MGQPVLLVLCYVTVAGCELQALFKTDLIPSLQQPACYITRKTVNINTGHVVFGELFFFFSPARSL